MLGDRFVMTRSQLAVCVWFCVFFVYLNYIPLFHSDIWCHVHYGAWMIDHGQWVTEDPFLPLAEGVRVVNNAWLSQVVFAGAERFGGAQLMSNLFAVVVLATYAIYSRVFYLISGRKWLAVVGMMLLLATGWTRHAIIRPEIFGGLFAALLFWLLIRVDPWRNRCEMWRNASAQAAFPVYFWIAIPLMFTLWANMHGSYAVGLVVLACHAIGITLESLWKHRSWARVIADPRVRRWVWLTELAVLATLLNPYGLDLLIETARFGKNENLRDVLEWYPLRLIDFEGIQVFIAVLVSFLLVRHSRRAFHPAEVLLMTMLAVMMASTVRMIGWLAPVWTVSMMPHLTDIWKRNESRVAQWWSLKTAADPEPSTADEDEYRWTLPPHAYTLIAGLAVWCAFALSPISQSLLGSKPRDLKQVLSKGTPHGVTKFLRENPPQGLIWAPQWWGDWLVWDGPQDLRVFMTTTLHLAPHSVWRDYMRIAHADAGWQAALDRYAVNTIVIDKELQPVMHRAVRRSGNWGVVHQDDQGVVYRRKHLITETPEAKTPSSADTDGQERSESLGEVRKRSGADQAEDSKKSAGPFSKADAPGKTNVGEAGK